MGGQSQSAVVSKYKLSILLPNLFLPRWLGFGLGVGLGLELGLGWSVYCMYRIAEVVGLHQRSSKLFRMSYYLTLTYVCSVPVI